MRTCVIFNPAAKGDKARKFRRHLDEIGADATLRQTCSAGNARILAADAVREGFEIVVAAGGDGTVNEVLNGIADVPGGLERAALGVLPLGTVNVFARELQIPRKLGSAWETIRDGRTISIDLPVAEFASAGVTARRHFAQLAGAGLDARAIEMVNWPLKKKIGPLAYVIAGLKALLGSQSNITVDDGEHSVTGELILIGNGRLYGGEFALFPNADLQDGALELCVFPRVNWIALARCGPWLLLRRKLPPKATVNLRASKVTLRSETGAALELDGELVGHLPATLSIQRSALRVVVPGWVRNPISVRATVEKL